MTAPIAGLKQQNVVDEIEVDLQHSRAVRHGPGGDTANGRVERHVPAMVDRRHERESHLADDLHPELQGRAGVAPRGLGQSRPDVSGTGRRIAVNRLHGSSQATIIRPIC